MSALARSVAGLRVPASPAVGLALGLFAITFAHSARAEEVPPVVFKGHTGPVYSLAYSPRGDILVSGSGDHTVKFWRLAESSERKTEAARRKQLIADLDDNRYDVRQRAFNELAALGDVIEGDLKVALRTSKSAEVRLRVRHLLAMLSVAIGVGHEGEIRSVAFSRDGKTVASAGRDNLVLLWSVSSGRVLSALKGHSDGVWCVSFSPDGQLLASGGGDQTIRIWNATNGQLETTLEGHTSTVQDLAFSPDGRTLASAGGFDKTLSLWDLQSGRQLGTLQGHTDAVLCVAFSPDGRQLASSGYDGLLLLWDVAQRRQTRSIDTAGGVVRGVAFSPDGRLVATAEDARSVKLWDAETGKLRAELPGHSDSVYAAVFSPDGRRMATASRDGIVRQWNLADRVPSTTP